MPVVLTDRMIDHVRPPSTVARITSVHREPACAQPGIGPKDAMRPVAQPCSSSMKVKSLNDWRPTGVLRVVKAAPASGASTRARSTYPSTQRSPPLNAKADPIVRAEGERVSSGGRVDEAAGIVGAGAVVANCVSTGLFAANCVSTGLFAAEGAAAHDTARSTVMMASRLTRRGYPRQHPAASALEQPSATAKLAVERPPGG